MTKTLLLLDPSVAGPYASDELGDEPPAMLWRIWDGTDDPAALQPLNVVRDTTKGLTTSGVVHLELPRGHAARSTLRIPERMIGSPLA